jgi:succinate dehydrogenase / fumarate reductase cytochrome b subunit
LKFGEEAEHNGNCTGRTCPRHYLAATGLVLGAFLVLHLAINALGLWPEIFQAAVNRNHAFGALLPVFELGLVFLPLAIHVGLGLRTLRRDKLSLGLDKHHVGSEVRYWLQRMTAVILLVFLAFHLATMHRWGFHLVYQITHWPALGRYAAGGLFTPQHAFASVSEALWHFWDKHAANPANWLILQLYLLGLTSAVFHLANGVATGAEVLGFVPTTAQNERLWRWCIGAGFILAAIGLTAWYAFAL